MKRILFIYLLCKSFLLPGQIPCDKALDSTALLATLKQDVNNFYFQELLPNCNISARIKELVAEKVKIPLYSIGQIDSLVTSLAVGGFPLNDTIYLYRKLAGLNDSLYFMIYDSIRHQNKINVYNEYKTSYRFGVPKNVILAVGWLHLENELTVLNDALNNRNYYYDPQFVRLSLARLGSAESILWCIKQINNIAAKSSSNSEWVDSYRQSAPFMIFPARQETLYEMHHWLDSSKISCPRVYSSGKCQILYDAYVVLLDLKFIIKNPDFQKILAEVNYIYEPFDEKLDITIEKAKKWMIRNKGKYMINPYHCPYL